MIEFNRIRKEFHQNGLSINQISQKYGISWATVEKTVNSTQEDIQKRGKRPGRKHRICTQAVKQAIHELLDEEEQKRVHRKQRHTSQTIFAYLIEKNIYRGAGRTLRRLIKNIKAERAALKQTSFLELEFKFGHYLQVDHGPATISLNGIKVEGNLFVASVPGALLRYCQFYLSKAQEFWGDFHENICQYFGGMFENIIYDNDSVLKINKTQTVTSFCLDMQSYYGFKAIFCNKASGWEKGSVENAVGYCRRNFLFGIKDFGSIEEVNQYLQDCSKRDVQKKKISPLGKCPQDLFNELSSILKRPDLSRQWDIWKELKVSSHQCISYQEHRYSVPEKYLGAKVRVFISAYRLKIFHGNDLIASHPRQFLEGEDFICLDHYLSQLQKKPIAFEYARVIREHPWNEKLIGLRRRLISLHGNSEGHCQLIKILTLKRRATDIEFSNILDQSLEINAISYMAFKSLLAHLQMQNIQCPEDGKIITEDYFQLKKYGKLETKEVENDRTDVSGPETLRCPGVFQGPEGNQDDTGAVVAWGS